MNNNSQILTVCIPTFNRSEEIKKQLYFFCRQVNANNDILKFVRFIVSDNASTDQTSNIVNKIKKNCNFFEYYRNKSNLGLVGNIIALLNRSKTEYIWFVSDDDIIKDGVLEEILKILKYYKWPEFIFLNYSSSNNIGFTGKTGYRFDSKRAALEIFQEAYGSLVFISACIYKRKTLLRLSNNPMFEWLSAPLLYSFYSCTKGPVFLEKVDWIKFKPNNASYKGLKRVTKLKFEEYITILEYLPVLGYDKKEVVKTIKTFFKKQSHSHLLYNFFNFSNSIRLYKYYSIKSFLTIPINIISYLRK